MDYIELSVKYAYSQSLKLITIKDILIAIILFSCVSVYGRKTKIANDEKRWFWLSVLIPYVYLVLAFTLINRPELPSRMIEYIPFWTIQEVVKTGKKVLLLECFLNVLMLIPFGYVLRKLNVKFSLTILLGIVLSYTIEISQFVTQRGLCELIDDPFHNVLGVAIGYWICRKATKT